MKKHVMKHTVLLLLALSLFALGGCTSEPQGADSGRLAALEAEVAALKAKSVAQEAAFRQELAQIRKNLEGIRSLIALDKERAKVDDTATPEVEAQKDKLQDDMDIKAKTFVNENLDRLLDITKKLLDKMETEIDEQMKKTAPPAPQPKGETI